MELMADRLEAEREDEKIESVQRPAGEGGDERPALRTRQRADRGKHGDPAGDIFASLSCQRVLHGAADQRAAARRSQAQALAALLARAAAAQPRNSSGEGTSASAL